MPVQVFVDDSGGKGHGKHFALVGLVAESESWEAFSRQWTAFLQAHPKISMLKIRDAAALRGEFSLWPPQARDDKLRKLARIINRYVKFVIWTVIDMDAHAQAWAKKPKPQNEVYFWPFHTVIMGVCLDLWDHGWRQPFEAIFDEQVIFGPRALAWYPLVKEIMRHREPEAACLLPREPVFQNDEHALPIQAADLYAWCIRRNTDFPEEQAFGWLLDELRDVKQSGYANYYDLDRMLSVEQQSLDMMAKNEIPQHLLALHQQLGTGRGRKR